MKVFIGYSEGASKTVADILYEWLPILVTDIELWMSERDIELGSQWIRELTERLAETDFGIVCLTSENMNSDWLLFEAGALAKAFEYSRVVPLLYGVKREQIPSPYRHLQTARMEKDHIYRLVKQLNSASGEKAKTENELQMLFDAVWPKMVRELESGLTQLLTEHPEQAYRYYAERFGVGHAKARFDCTIKDDGTAEVQRFITVDAFGELQTLDTILLFPEARTADKQGNLELTRIASLDTLSRLTYRRIEDSEPHRLRAEISFKPPLQKGERLSYWMSETANSPVFRLGNTQTDTSSEPEYFGWNVIRPTQRLELRVLLPENESPENYWADVRRASLGSLPANRPEEAELARIKEPNLTLHDDGQRELFLSVDFPVNGFIYFIRWEPRHVV